MKVKINTDSGEKEVEIKGLRGKHRKQFLVKIREVSEKAKEKDIGAIGQMSEFLDYQDDLLVEVSNLGKEEYDNLELEEQNKLISALRKILFPQSQDESLF